MLLLDRKFENAQLRDPIDLKERTHSASVTDLDGAPGGAAAGGRLTPKQREQQLRRQRALELRSEGKTLTEIADELGWSAPSGVSYALKVARKELREAAPVEDLKELRRLHFARFEEMFSRAYPLAVGGMRDGKQVPPSPKYMRLALRILADETELMGLKVDPDEVLEAASQGITQPGAGNDAAPVMVVDFDKQQFEAARRRSGRLARDEPIFVDDQPPAGYIAPRPGANGAPEDVALEPNSVDPRTGQRVFDPRVAVRRD
jgi:hypothetical protein